MHYLVPPPLRLINNGLIQMKNVRSAKISVDHRFSELRKQQIEDIAKVALALWEPGGIISMFLEPQYQPLAVKDMNIPTSSFSLVKPIIVEGSSDDKMLAQLGKDHAWLEAQIQAKHLDMKDVELATIDDQNHIRVYTDTNLDTNQKDEQTLF